MHHLSQRSSAAAQSASTFDTAGSFSSHHRLDNPCGRRTEWRQLHLATATCTKSLLEESLLSFVWWQAWEALLRDMLATVRDSGGSTPTVDTESTTGIECETPSRGAGETNSRRPLLMEKRLASERGCRRHCTKCQANASVHAGSFRQMSGQHRRRGKGKSETSAKIVLPLRKLPLGRSKVMFCWQFFFLFWQGQIGSTSAPVVFQLRLRPVAQPTTHRR